jgi:hypothetical protein
MAVEPDSGSLECVEQVRALNRHVALARVDDELAFRAGARDRAEEFLALPYRCAAVHLALDHQRRRRTPVGMEDR